MTHDIRVWGGKTKKWLYTNKESYILSLIKIEAELCTTVKDKNGELLFHNDIITDSKRIYLIEWSDEELTWILTNPNMRGYLKLADVNNRFLTLLGNNHEHGDLLNTLELIKEEKPIVASNPEIDTPLEVMRDIWCVCVDESKTGEVSFDFEKASEMMLYYAKQYTNSSRTKK